MKHYKSFTEIDERLRILRLQRQIDSDHLKLHLNRARSSLYPSNLLCEFSGIAQKVLLTFVIKKLSRFSRLLQILQPDKKISDFY